MKHIISIEPRELHYWASIPEKWKLMFLKKNIYIGYKGMFITALCAIAQNGNLSRCPSIGQWSNKLRYIQTVEQDSALKGRNYY